MNGFASLAEDQRDYEQCSSIFHDDKFEDMGLEASKYVVGPMPVDHFLQRFLRSLTPNPTPLPPILFANFGLSSEVALGESELYAKFINAVQPICSNFELRDVHSNSMHAFESHNIQPDLCVFRKGISDIDLCDPSQPEIMIIFKLSIETDDPFDDGEYVTLGEDGTSKTETYFLREARAGRHTLGQLTAYAAAQHAAQFRTHIFSVLVFPKHARLFRWDRSGVVVTERFLLCSRYFLEFFHLYNHATPHVRGLDISASIPSEDNASKARVALGDSSLPLAQLSVGSSSYIISRKVYMNHDCPFGRSTRGFVAYSVSLNETVFLKDSWRLGSQTPEHDVYQRLRSSNVPHIPTVIEGGDILDNKTLTQDLLEEDLVWIRDPPRRLKKHRHYRLILKEIATPLRSFSSTKILVSAIHDTIEAHRAAYFNAGILHRDISSGNIMIYNNGGLLIDWDLSKSKDNGARGSERTGTWQFIACRLLEDPTAVQDLTDDVESFIHVLTLISFRYAKHNLSNETVNAYLASIFDRAYYEKDGLAKGGDTKMNYLSSPSQLTKTQFENPILKELLLTITDTIATRYRETPSLKEAKGSLTVLKHLVNAHEETLVRLKDSEWIIGEFASALKSPSWPANDEARKYENTQITQSTTHTKVQSPSLKRKSSKDPGGKNKKTRALRIEITETGDTYLSFSR
ncbi:hypothetical protein Clacol_003370 [Clathrus columnatus]|uniref:Fungal-type protein kinase domain-containing protein n=1 Tax=Clathrus columnatus TaxID=1419009 RepID=A0AAV5A924_9AGAM|nr:hypothetical protein Clacol_003370 [Clathrus columnatus]